MSFIWLVLDQAGIKTTFKDKVKKPRNNGPAFFAMKNKHYYGWKCHLYRSVDTGKLFLSLCLLIGLQSFSQTPSLPNIKLEHGIRITTNEGLPSNSIRAFAETDDGFIWIGTAKGLCRFDGTQFKIFDYNPLDSTSIYDGRISSMLIDGDDMWVGTHLGVSLFHMPTETFKNYQFENYCLTDSLSKKVLTRVMCLEKDAFGEIWMGTFSDGIFRYDQIRDTFINYHYPQEKVAPYFPSPARINHVLTIKQDRFNDSIIWIGTLAGLLKMNTKTNHFDWKLIPKVDEASFLIQNAVRSTYQHSDGKLYLASWNAGVHVFDPKKDSFQKLPLKNIRPNELADGIKLLKGPIAPIIPKNDNEIWIKSTLGLMTYDLQTSCWTDLQWNDLNRNKVVGPAFIDSRNRAWTKGLGVHLYDPTQQQFIEYDFGQYHNNFSGFSSFIFNQYIDNKIAVVPKSSDGFFFLDMKRRSWDHFVVPAKFRAKTGDFRPRGFSLSPTGTWTIATTEGIFDCDLKTGSINKISIPSGYLQKYPFDILWDRQERLWIGTQDEGLLRWTPSRNKWEVFEEELTEGMPGNDPGSIPELFEDSQSNIWFRRSLGYSVFVNKEQQFYNIQTGDTSENTRIPFRHFIEDHQGKIWMHNNQGILAQADSRFPEKGIINTYDQFFDRILLMAIDTSGMIWVLNEEEISSFNPLTLQEKKHKLYGVTESDFYSLNILPDNTIVIGGRNKIWVSNPQELQSNKETSTPYLTNILVLQNPIESDTAIHLIKRLSLKPDENFFSFEFSSIAFTSGAKNTFRFRLLNFDDSWTTASERKFANYTNVPPGDYTFQLQVANNEGTWNEKYLSLPVRIANPWWNTAWFWFLSGASILGLAYSIYTYRTRQIRKEERLRLHYEQRLSNMEMSALRAQMNPHFIFNAMNSIEYFIINNEQEKAIDYLNRFSRLIRLILQNSKNTIVPLQDDLEALKLYLEIENMRFDELFDYEIKIEKNLDTALIQVPPMLMQPYVENAIWHGLLQKKNKDGKIGITIRKDKESLVCLIEDNGIGRTAAEKLKSKSGTRKKSFGMKITSDRLDALNKITGTNASVNIYDLQNKDHEPTGTRVELIIPV